MQIRLYIFQFISSVYQWPELNESERLKAKAKLETFTSRVLNCRCLIMVMVVMTILMRL